MAIIQPNNALDASKVRKQFYRMNPSFTIGDLVRTDNGDPFVFQGITTHHDPHQITVLGHPYAGSESQPTVKLLPTYLTRAGYQIPVIPAITENPEICTQEEIRFINNRYRFESRGPGFW